MPYLPRPLQTQENVRDFFRDVLEIDFERIPTTAEKNKLASLIQYVSSCEIANITYSKLEESTLMSRNHRRSLVSTDIRRWQLRNRIVNELFTLPRLADDDDIKLGRGGAKPNTAVKNEHVAYIVIGPPASGKSGIANGIADALGAYILDNDYAKRKLPEYKDLGSGATLVHEESAFVVLPTNRKVDGTPAEFKTLFELCVEKGTNIVIPKIGHQYKAIYELANLLKSKFGYTVHLVAVSLDRKHATLRAFNRLRDTKRYVPLGLIFDGYSNDPILTYYRLKRLYNNGEFASFGKISTDVPKGSKVEVIEDDGRGHVPLI